MFRKSFAVCHGFLAAMLRKTMSRPISHFRFYPCSLLKLFVTILHAVYCYCCSLKDIKTLEVLISNVPIRGATQNNKEEIMMSLFRLQEIRIIQGLSVESNKRSVKD